MEFKVQKEVLDSGVKIVFAAVDGMDFAAVLWLLTRWEISQLMPMIPSSCFMRI